MDRRQMLGAAAVALGGSFMGLPAEAVVKYESWIILRDPHDVDGNGQSDEICFGSILKATKNRKHVVKPNKNKLVGADSEEGKPPPQITVSETDGNRGTYSGLLLAKVPPLPPDDPKFVFRHAANAIPVVKYNAASWEARKACDALAAVHAIIPAYFSPTLDALDQVDAARDDIKVFEREVHDSRDLSTEDKDEIQGYIQQARGFLNQTQSAIEQGGNNATIPQIIAIVERVLTTAAALQVPCAMLLPAP